MDLFSTYLYLCPFSRYVPRYHNGIDGLTRFYDVETEINGYDRLHKDKARLPLLDGIESLPMGKTNEETRHQRNGIKTTGYHLVLFLSFLQIQLKMMMYHNMVSQFLVLERRIVLPSCLSVLVTLYRVGTAQDNVLTTL